MEADLSGKRALVCGASKGIGRAIALELKSRGADVTAVARSEENLKTLDMHYISADFSDQASRQQFVDSLDGDYQILVCNSAGPASGLLHEADAGEFIKAIDQHIVTNHMLLQKLIPGMKKASYGRVITILSTSVKSPIPNLGVSNTLRAAVANWAKTLSHELGPFGITVNNVLPGFVDTERLGTLMTRTSERLDKSEDEVKKMWKATVPVGRFGQAEELANAVAFLSSPAASYINGINLPVDGGRLGCL